MPSSDIVVIGGGANGLACAIRLVRGGARVTLLEAEPEVGGGATTVEFAPGYRVSGLAHLVHGLDARLVAATDLAGQGFRATDPLPTTLPGADPLTVPAAGGGPGDWSTLMDRLGRHATRLAPLRSLPPPRLGAGNDWRALTGVGFGLARAGRADLRDLMRLILINVADVAEDELSDERLRALLAFDATLGAWAGPRSPGTLLLYLNRLALGGVRAPMGGMGRLAAALRAAAEGAGVTIRTAARVTAIAVAGDRARGVTLATGETLRADHVVSALCARTTLEGLVGPAHLDTGTVRRIAAMPFHGGAAKLHIALTGAPGFGADLRHRFVLAPSVDAVERAFNPVKYGEVPDRPVAEVLVPTAHDPSLAPEGHHVLSVIAQFAPHAPKDPDAAKAAFTRAVLSVLEHAAPGLSGQIAHVETLMPADIAARYGLRGGSWHHGDLAAERMLFLRPFPEAARYRAPLPGLWLASAATHPGGGVTGTAGWNAAEALLKEAA